MTPLKISYNNGRVSLVVSNSLDGGVDLKLENSKGTTRFYLSTTEAMDLRVWLQKWQAEV